MKKFRVCLLILIIIGVAFLATLFVICSDKEFSITQFDPDLYMGNGREIIAQPEINIKIDKR